MQSLQWAIRWLSILMIEQNRLMYATPVARTPYRHVSKRARRCMLSPWIP
jgi:hypothetical protein